VYAVFSFSAVMWAFAMGFTAGAVVAVFLFRRAQTKKAAKNNEQHSTR
jgi:hypothetical protein